MSASTCRQVWLGASTAIAAVQQPHTRARLYTLPPNAVEEQVDLAVELEGLGVDVIQTEGKFSLDPSK